VQHGVFGAIILGNAIFIAHKAMIFISFFIGAVVALYQLLSATLSMPWPTYTQNKINNLKIIFAI
jgi:hypothetical protein